MTATRQQPRSDEASDGLRQSLKRKPIKPQTEAKEASITV